MFKPEHIKDGLLKRYAVVVPKGQHLFQQNEKGNTMLILIEGIVELYHKTNKEERLVGILAEGEILGERAILGGTPFRRIFTALAKTETTVLQFDHQALKLIQSNMPDFTLKLLGLCIKRLERANQMVAILQLSDPAERIAMYLLHAVEHFAKKTPAGDEIVFRPSEVKDFINVNPSLIAETVQELVAEKIIQLKGDALLLPNEDALLHYIPTLKEKIAA